MNKRVECGCVALRKVESRVNMKAILRYKGGVEGQEDE